MAKLSGMAKAKFLARMGKKSAKPAGAKTKRKGNPFAKKGKGR